MNAQIAKHLNILESAIIRVEEWSKVFFVVARGIGARFVSKKVATKMESAPVRVYEGIFGQIQLDGKHVDLASSIALMSKDGHKFLRQNFKPGDLIETANGVQMLDKNFNPMKANFHVKNPDLAKKLAGI